MRRIAHCLIIFQFLSTLVSAELNPPQWCFFTSSLKYEDDYIPMLANLKIPNNDDRYQEFFHCLFSELKYLKDDGDINYKVIEGDIETGYSKKMAEQIKKSCNKPPAPIPDELRWGYGLRLGRTAIFKYVRCVFREIKKDKKARNS